ncbi:hypothetical protein [Methanoculleus chikugoensis]|uniref:hypothetical protein n=1 Tax=Methanoculleus chikugoensis TaxID=118126 RepID=UPI001FB33249|nr:hypothetical protein [Methanoculleus chikugoensis]
MGLPGLAMLAVPPGLAMAVVLRRILPAPDRTSVPERRPRPFAPPTGRSSSWSRPPASGHGRSSARSPSSPPPSSRCGGGSTS